MEAHEIIEKKEGKKKPQKVTLLFCAVNALSSRVYYFILPPCFRLAIIILYHWLFVARCCLLSLYLFLLAAKRHVHTNTLTKMRT